MSADYEVQGGIAVITMNNPPVNGLGHATRGGIFDGLKKALADSAVKAIVITGAGRAFSGGADIREFNTPKSFAEPNLLSVIAAIEGADKTAKEVFATTMAHAKKIRKTGMVSGVCDGFIGNRMIEQYARQAGFLLEEGCLPEQMDRAIEAFGFVIGPFRMGDLAGNDVGWYIRKRRYAERPDVIYSKTADLLCEMAASARGGAPAGTTTSRATASPIRHRW